MGEHDQLFKAAFRVPASAAGELASVLPADAIDLNSLELVHGDLVSRQLDERFSDALFRANFKNGTSGFIWLLLEHQSTPDRWMPLRVLEKMVRTWEDWRRETPEPTSLPPFICVVVHHGENGWQAATRLHQLVEGLAAFPSWKRFVPDFELVVDDLPHQSAAELHRRPLGPWPKLVRWALRDARDEERLLGPRAPRSLAPGSRHRERRQRAVLPLTSVASRQSGTKKRRAREARREVKRPWARSRTLPSHTAASLV